MNTTMMRIGIALLCAFVLWPISGTAAEGPNVVLVMADDLGWGDLQCFNEDSPIKTPHLDAMADQGLRFNRFYAAAPVCSPTRGSCLTGRHPYRFGVYSANRGHLREQEIALPELLKEQGYATGHFGKWHLGTLTRKIKDSNRGGPKGKDHFSPPRMHGYDVCFVTEAKVPTYDPMLKPKDGERRGWDPIQDKSTAVEYGTRYWDGNGQIVTENLEGDDSRVIMDRAIPFIEQAAHKGQSFFAVVWFHAPHLPVVAEERHQAPYVEQSEYVRNYRGCVAALDEQVGRLRAKLRELKVAEETMLWFCSDNGPEGNGSAPGSTGGLRGRKRSLYEGGVRVPGILEWPAKVRAGTETDFAAVTSDYLPTVLELLGLSLPDDRPLDGVSLLPVLEGEATARSQPIGFQSRNRRAWTGQQYKLYSGDGGATWELYDLESDPAEARDLVSAQPGRVRAMSRQLNEWIDSCQASDAGKDY